MESIDPAKASRVWQRVQGSLSASNPETLPGLICEEQHNARMYGQLAAGMLPRQARLLRQMAAEALSNAACLKGMYILLTGNTPATPSSWYENEPAHRALSKCYGREIRCLTAYEARSADPEYGQCFTALAARKKSQCLRLLELIGNSTP